MNKSIFFLILCFVSFFKVKAQAPEYPFFKDIVSFYKDLHQNPELSFQEKETSIKLASALRKVGYEVKEGIGGYGVVAVLKNGEGPVVLVRADMDALPLKEDTQCPFASTKTTTDGEGRTVSVMHACGHDMHMSVLLGTAQYLSENKKSWKGTLVFIGQPAEERGGGAKAMLAAGLYKDFPIPNYGLALHCSASIPSGKVGICSGYSNANVDMLDIIVKGRGGHGAYPHTTIDPVVLASKIVLNIQTIVSREISPTEPAVITVGSIHGGSKHNIISNEVKLELTLRSYSEEVRSHLLKAIDRICQGEAMAAGLTKEEYPVLNLLGESIPSLYNDPVLTQRIENVFSTKLGAESIVKQEAVMGGEDFSLFGRTEHKVPVSMFWLGTVPVSVYEEAQKKQQQLPSLHSPYYLPDLEGSLRTGIFCMSSAVLELLKK